MESQDKTPAKSPGKTRTPAKESRKRKSVELDEDDDEGTIALNGRKASSRKSRKIDENDDYNEDEDDFVPTSNNTAGKKGRNIM